MAFDIGLILDDIRTMKKVTLYLLTILLFSGFISSDQEISKGNPTDFISRGEKLEYRVHYGFVNAGEAVVQVHPELYIINGKVCYKATCFGKSVGAFDLVTRIRDTWGTYMDTATLLPQRSYRDITENRYKLKEGVYFYHNKGTADAEREHNGETKKISYQVPFGVQDIISGFYFLRSLDYNKIRVGDTIKINAFFEDKMYDFRIMYKGKEKLDTKFGHIQTIKLVPLMPDNQLFDGENSIRVWLTDDRNKVPIKMQADMFVGAVEVDLRSYKGLKSEMTFSKK